jgi:hypothetical protein
LLTSVKLGGVALNATLPYAMSSVLRGNPCRSKLPAAQSPADGRIASVATRVAPNRALATKQRALAAARRSAEDAEAEVLRECKSGFGRNCEGWRKTLADRQATLAQTAAEVASMSASPVDPKGDAVVRLATLVGASDGERVRAIVAALDPVMLPLFLELGSILFFGAAFPHAKSRETVGEDEGDDREDEGDDSEATYTREEALADLLDLIASGAVTDGRLLARRWGVSETTTSRWLSSWTRAGLIGRARDGRSRRPVSA